MNQSNPLGRGHERKLISEEIQQLHEQLASLQAKLDKLYERVWDKDDCPSIYELRAIFGKTRDDTSALDAAIAAAVHKAREQWDADRLAGASRGALKGAEMLRRIKELEAAQQPLVDALREIAEGRTEEAAFIADAALAKVKEGK
jgi:hypothetical protein